MLQKENNLVFMNEIGLDPGIDHMSAMKVIDEIRDKGG
jgi:saccharopine dehydrogenase-like NADP-dependent oxidoreductase